MPPPVDLDPCVEFPQEYAHIGQVRFDSKLNQNLLALKIEAEILKTASKNV